MKVTTASVYDILLRMRDYFQADNPIKKYDDEAPIRSELFSSDQMEHQGIIVAGAHKLVSEGAPNQLLKRLDNNENVLLKVRTLLAETIKINKRITPAGEWMLDNFYLIEEQISIGKKHLPKGYSKGLPILSTGPSAGLPRVYDIALEIISHSDGRIDLKSLDRFVTAYQTVTKLTLGELWAIPIMLRLALIENLRRVSSRIAMDKIDQNLANYWSEQLIEAAESNPKNLILLIADMARSNPPLDSPFVAELIRQLQGKGPSLAMPLTWMEQQLNEVGFTSNELVHQENQKQASDQISVSNSIGSLRFLGTTDWREFVESLSWVEKKLKEDPTATYELMDFATRDQYRHSIEKIAKKSPNSEPDVAQMAIDLANECFAINGINDRRSHVGFYLVGKGLPTLQAKAGMSFTPWEKITNTLSGANLFIYIGSIILIAALIAAGMCTFAHFHGVHGWWLAALAVLSFQCTSHFSVSLVNWMATLIVRPKQLPRMDFSKGIPHESNTMVVIPTLITSLSNVDSLVESLEVRFLANPGENLHFALLTDFADAPNEKMPDDDALLKQISTRVQELNQKYNHPGTDLFFLFHRPRKWNERDKIWMGYERKRGKLSELNELLRGKAKDCFSLIVGNYETLSPVKYIITLDTDTQLPRETAWKFTATMAHPLNRPFYNDKKQRVTDGYGILQPRVSVSMPVDTSSWYTRIHASDTGLDPYTRAVSDVYQDLFREGSFIGKGIYDLDVFESTLKGRFQENRILSHDLLEGCYTRSGLLSDVELYEDYPSSYNADVKRRHRWIRGDWQIGAWMMPFVSGATGKLHKNRLSILSRWKIFDNVRRSLLPACLTALLLLGWLLLGDSWFWTMCVTGIIILPYAITNIWQLTHKSKEQDLRQHLMESVETAWTNFLQMLLQFSTLPYEAYYTLDAVLRTSWRMTFSKKHLLEWTPSASTKLSKNDGLPATYFNMIAGPLMAAVSFLYLSWHAPMTILIASPILILWVLSPAIAWWISRPLEKEQAKINSEQKIFLQKLARKTWSYFEEFVSAQENWLPPDNFQEHPTPVIAHRTSPTNLGLSLLANLGALDFGYITIGEMMMRTDLSIQSMAKLERYRGHFYNWYDTLSLQPLYPRYISAVDSGNLGGHLLTMRQGLLAMPAKKIISDRLFEGLRDTFKIALDNSTGGKENNPLYKLLKTLDDLCDNHPETISATKNALDDLVNNTASFFTELPEDTQSDLQWWMNAFDVQLKKAIGEITALAPWTLRSPIPARFVEIGIIETIGSLNDLVNDAQNLYQLITDQEQSQNSAEEIAWLKALRNDVAAAAKTASERIEKLKTLAAQCENMADMEYDFLYDQSKHLLRIGVNVEDNRKDVSYYDMLASEVRLAIFVAISQGKLPQESWFTLGRLLTNTGGEPVLLSWSGSMFEYLMPLLVMPTYEKTLLDQTNKATVQRQIAYGKQRGIPWGISESGYNAVDTSLNYQYHAFGVPGLGLKRGLGDDLVIAPYASMMALMVDPEAAATNLQLLAREGFQGKYGFFEAVDYTPARLPRGQSNAIVRSFMVHHQGMGFLSLAYLLLDKPMQDRFEAEPQFQATMLLLQERIPRATIFYSQNSETANTSTEAGDPEMRVITTPDTAIPELQLLSNSKYQVMISNSGGGYSRWKDIAVTRWREDGTRDDRGIFCYIKDVDSGEFWSNTYQPTLKVARTYEAVFSQGHAEFKRRDDNVETRTEVVVSPEDDTEMRRVRITNRSLTKKIIEVTSYAEVVLADPNADIAHPAFSNLFVQTQIIKDHNAIICTRRPRSDHDNPPWMFHLMNVQHVEIESVTYETDRSKFIGRGKTVAAPAAMDKNFELSNSEGSVLDPIVAIRYRMIIKPSQTATIDMVYGIGETRDICAALMEKYQDRYLKNRAFELSWTHSQVLLRQINASEADAQLFGRMAASIIYMNANLRADPSIIKSNQRGQSGLWSYSISGDLPIVLLRVEDAENLDLVKKVVQAHAYWRLKGLALDLVIWNEDHGTYRQVLHDQILGLITAASGAYLADKPGGVFVRSADQISNEDRILFQTVARVIISDDQGSLSDQINKKVAQKALPAMLSPTSTYEPRNNGRQIAVPTNLLCFNGIGGFAPDGKEYVIATSNKQTTPAPWVNVIANPDFGTVVSESGSAYTWSENAHEFRLTPWDNDPVSDTGGEAFYIRDEESGHFWTPAPLPVRSDSTYLTRHGFGYTVFEHIEDGIRTEMWVYVDVAACIKFITIKTKNISGRARKLSATGYVEWVLGDIRAKSAMYIVTEADNANGALFSRNKYNSVFCDRVAFFDTDDTSRTVTTDRAEFIGRNGSLGNPEAMRRSRLSGRTGAAMDPCAALQVSFDLYDGQEKEIVFRLGSGKTDHEARQTAQQFKGLDTAKEALQKVRAFWDETLNVVQVATPDQSLNLLANGWLSYQILSSRLWARSGYYQSGGAYGYRDQLQDTLALIHSKPEITRAQILLCASRQFKEGDVQHWWHPPTGRGVRTRCSDDFLWLPYATARYITGTGDIDILNEAAHFLDGRVLNLGEESYFDLPNQNEQQATLYKHCVSAIRYGLQFGVHGLPLIGSGDWNDGMDMVGQDGKGESIWLGFFLYDVLKKFAVIAEQFGDKNFSDECNENAAKLQKNLEDNGWDGGWYRRAYFDDGTPLGSAGNTECRIDSISQSWSVLSGAGNPERSRMGMEAVNKYLVRRDSGLIQLLDPPFDKAEKNPGYIKGYVPGVRENGGQYTHAAIWTLMAFAALGENARVWELFSMINPVNHGNTADLMKVYKVEPYVVAADIYAASPHNGRGGWTWYTGSAGWMYHFILDSLLGIRVIGTQLHFEPCIPQEWKSFKMQYKYRTATYQITVLQEHASETTLRVDNVAQDQAIIDLKDDGAVHDVVLKLADKIALVTPTA